MSTGEFHAVQPRDREDDPGEQPTQEHQAPEITFDEQFYPARPKKFRPSARRSLRRRLADRLGGDDIADNREYVEWLVEQSMLHDANRLATQLSGSGGMWQNPFAHPDPRAAVERASVWFTAYPLSFVTGKGESYLSALADRRLWDAFRRIGIDGLHTGPVKLAGGLNGRRLTPSIDGHFDRISMEVDPEFGTEEQFRMLCATAAEYEGTVIDDIVPGHTGKGADFRLAEMAYQDYPGHLPHGLDRARGLGAAARRPRRPRQRQPRRGHRSGARARRIHHRPAPAGDLLRARHQGDQLVGDALREGRGRRGPALGLPALLQGGPAFDQLAGSELLRHAARDRRRAARPGGPRRGRPAAGRERLPRRREERGGGARVVGRAIRSRRPRTTSSLR